MHIRTPAIPSPASASTPALPRLGVLAALLLGSPLLTAAETALDVLEPTKPAAAEARKPERARWSWDQQPAEVTATGDLAWKPAPFVLEAGKTVRYIDFDKGSDAAAGTKEAPWKHHPWDAAATGAAKDAKGVATYVFKRGVVYRGELHPTESGTAAEPIRLTSDPSWSVAKGQGEAVIAGSEAVTGWKKGADRADIPEAGSVWYADIDFAPRSVWAVADGKIQRVELARSPNWKVSDGQEVKSEWWRLEQPNWWANNCTGLKVDFAGHRSHLGIDTAHLTEPADHYVGATAHVEYGWVMGTPFPTRVEGFDEGRKGIFFQGIWFGDSENIPTGMHYYLEDKANFLDSAGEFWFDEGKKRLYVRLPGDADPSTVTVEAAKRINLIDSTGLAHVAITGLSFRFTNTYWDLTQPAWGNVDVNNACIRVRGAAEDLRVANCRFDHCAKAVRIDAAKSDVEKREDQPLDRIVVADNDIDQTDHGAIEIGSHGVGDVKVLRNHLHEIGLRTFRQDHSHALVVTFPETMEIAGNILERTTGSGLFIWGGKGSGDARDVPLARNLIHHNKAVDTLLSANDWGGIETWQGGPFYNYSNISGNPNGFWNGYDATKPGTARLGFAYYHDGGFKNYDFNQIAYGTSTDWTSKLACNAAFYEATQTIENQIFNCTISKFWVGTQWSPGGGRHFFLGNIFDQIGGQVFQHGKLKEDKDPPPAGNYPHDSTAYGRNVFSGVPANFAVYETSGTGYADPATMAASFAAHPALAGDVGTLAPQSPLRDPDKLDFRPKPGSAAVDHGVKVFVPWALSRTVGEWQFRRDNADPTVILDSHWYMTPYYLNRDSYCAMPVFNLRGQHVAARDFTAGPLEDWTDGALVLDGKEQFASLANAELAKGFTYDAGNNQQKTVTGKDYATPDIDDGNLLIEAYIQTKARGSVLVAKMADAGYQLAVNKAGGVTFTVKGGGQKAELASGAVIADGKWHHVIAELDRGAGAGAIYTDGKKTAGGKLALPAGASLTNTSDLLVGKNAEGHFFAGSIEFLRIARGTLADAKTTIDELYDWEFDGPFLRDFAGHEATGKGRDAGAFEATDK